MAIIGTLPNPIVNGQALDAVPVMADLNWIVNQVNANSAASPSSPGGGWTSTNGLNPISATCAGNALTISLQPQTINFRSPTLADGSVNARTIATTLSMTVPSGCAIGTLNGTLARLYVLALDVGDGTVQVAVINPTVKYFIDEDELASSLAIAASGAGAANTCYSTSALSNVPYRIMGWIEITEATAGVWATQPSTVQPNGGYGVIAALLDLIGISGLGGTYGVGGSISTNGLTPITATCAANALTVTVPAQTMNFRSPTQNDGSVVVRTIATPLTITVPSGATLGTINGGTAIILVGVMDLGNGSCDISVINQTLGYQYNEITLATSSAIGGASNSTDVIYSNAAHASPLPYRIIGAVVIQEAAAGTWVTQPTIVQPAGGMGIVSILNVIAAVRNPPPPSAGQIGYVGIPPNTQTANYTTVAADNGKYIYHPASDVTPRTYTIDAAVTYSSTGGGAITFVNMSVGAVSVAISGGTLYWSPTGAVGTRTVAQFGELTALQIGTTTGWLATGSGVT